MPRGGSFGFLGFKFGSGNSGLADNPAQGSSPNLRMIWDWNRNFSIFCGLLKDDMAPPPSDFLESMFLENFADFFTGKNPESTQRQPQVE